MMLAGFTYEQMIGLKRILDERDQTLEEFLEPFQPSKTPNIDEFLAPGKSWDIDPNALLCHITMGMEAAREDIKRNAQ